MDKDIIQNNEVCLVYKCSRILLGSEFNSFRKIKLGEYLNLNNKRVSLATVNLDVLLPFISGIPFAVKYSWNGQTKIEFTSTFNQECLYNFVIPLGDYEDILIRQISNYSNYLLNPIENEKGISKECRIQLQIQVKGESFLSTKFNKGYLWEQLQFNQHSCKDLIVITNNDKRFINPFISGQSLNPINYMLLKKEQAKGSIPDSKINSHTSSNNSKDLIQTNNQNFIPIGSSNEFKQYKLDF